MNRRIAVAAVLAAVVFAPTVHADIDHTGPADVRKTAERLTPPAASACDQSAQAANELDYRHLDAGPALDAFYSVAVLCREWESADALASLTAVSDIVLLESGACPLVRRGGIVNADCSIRRQGPHPDAGFGQVVPRSHPWLCTEYLLCDSEAIVSSPFTSMLALVLLLERHGVEPWCYDSRARRIHRVACSNPPPQTSRQTTP